MRPKGVAASVAPLRKDLFQRVKGARVSGFGEHVRADKVPRELRGVGVSSNLVSETACLKSKSCFISCTLRRYCMLYSRGRTEWSSPDATSPRSSNPPRPRAARPKRFPSKKRSGFSKRRAPIGSGRYSRSRSRRDFAGGAGGAPLGSDRSRGCGGHGQSQCEQCLRRSDREGAHSGRTRIGALSALAIDALRAQKARQAQDRLAAGPTYQARGFVFADELGAMLHPPAVTSAFMRTSKRR
jgi:hypothetical protein